MSASECHEGFFETFDHLNLFFRFYRKPDAEHTVIIFHGHGEHSGRYKKFSEILKDKKVNIAAYDFRGHGKSEGRQVYVDDYRQFVHDADSFVDFLKTRGWVRNQVIVIAHSNGALTAAHWMDSHKTRIRGAILSSPFFGLKLPLPLIFLNRIINFLNPKFVYANPVYPPYLTHNEEEVKLYKQDPCIRRKITARLLEQMLSYIRKLDDLREINWPFPCFIQMSGMDKVVDPEKTKEFYAKLKTPLKDLVIYDEMYHEIFNEAGQEKVFDQLRIFLDRIIA